MSKKLEDVIEEIDVTLEKNEKEDEVNEFLVLTEKIKDLEEANLRLQSEFQNYKRRTEKERLSYIKQANADLIENMLSVIDDFERAINGVTDEKLKGYLEGFKLIHDNMMKILKKEGLEEIKSLDKTFDPNIHQAVTTDKVKEKDKDVILEVFQKGYKFNDKLIRPAMVKVNK